jgi:hypothetical protein
MDGEQVECHPDRKPRQRFIRTCVVAPRPDCAFCDHSVFEWVLTVRIWKVSRNRRRMNS